MQTQLWTCKDIMSQNLVVATIGDNAVEIAQKMRSADVGSIPIVESLESKTLLGVVTDRDLVLRVLADELEPSTSMAQSIMTENPVTCDFHTPVETAMQLMSHHQVRRIPVIDEDGRLLGIIAQADIARHLDTLSTGQVVENISQE